MSLKSDGHQWGRPSGIEPDLCWGRAASGKDETKEQELIWSTLRKIQAFYPPFLHKNISGEASPDTSHLQPLRWTTMRESRKGISLRGFLPSSLSLCQPFAASYAPLPRSAHNFRHKKELRFFFFFRGEAIVFFSVFCPRCVDILVLLSW